MNNIGVTSWPAFEFKPPAAMSAIKAARACEAVARYRALMLNDDFMGPGSDVMRLRRLRPIEEPKRHVDPEHAPRPSSVLPPALFHLPRPPIGRPRTAGGMQSFHFELTNVTKGVDGLCRTNDGRAADPVGHVDYVGREEAVATEASRDVQDAVSHIGYVSRESAVALDHAGAAIILSNIDGEPADFFATVLAHENSGRPDGICLSEAVDPVMLQSLLQNPRISPELKCGIESILADPEAHRVDKSGSPKSKTHPFQVDVDISGCDALLKEHDPSKQLHLRRGRGGIVQRRITGELPAELGPERCRRVLKKLAAELEQRGLRYYVALHAPTAANHHHNWHFHLLYYDRPCDRIDGAWDFTIVKENRTSSRNRTQSYPHRQKKHADIGHKDWPMYMRQRFAAAVNVELKAIDAPRGYDPRSYRDMGIEAEPQDHLARGPAFRAACGAAPAKDIENARKGWSARYIELLKRHDQIEKDDAVRIADLRATIGEKSKDHATLTELERELAGSRADARTADVLYFILHCMALSNGEQTARKMKGHADELASKLRAAGKNPAHQLRHEAFKQRERDAESYLADLERTFAPDVTFAASLMTDAQAARRLIDEEFKVLHGRSVWISATSAVTAPTEVLKPTLVNAVKDLKSEDATIAPINAPPATSSRSVKTPPEARPTSSAVVDDWLARIQRLRRRVTRRDERVEPYKINDLDRQMLALASPEQLKELDRIRDRQNRLIDRIVAAVKAAPGILVIPEDGSSKWTLAHRDTVLQDGLRHYIGDPNVQERLRVARDESLAQQSATQPATPQIHRVIDEVFRTGLQVHRRNEGLVISDADAAHLKITPEDLKAPSVQRRLAAIFLSQEERIARAEPTSIAGTPAVVDSAVLLTDVPRAFAPSPKSAPSEMANSARSAAADTFKSSPAEPPVVTHPLIVSWREAHDSNLQPGGAISIAERNRRAAMALKDKVAVADMERLSPAILAEVTAQANTNAKFQQRVASMATRPRLIR